MFSQTPTPCSNKRKQIVANLGKSFALNSENFFQQRNKIKPEQVFGL